MGLSVLGGTLKEDGSNEVEEEREEAVGGESKES